MGWPKVIGEFWLLILIDTYVTAHYISNIRKLCTWSGAMLELIVENCVLLKLENYSMNTTLSKIHTINTILLIPTKDIVLYYEYYKYLGVGVQNTNIRNLSHVKGALSSLRSILGKYRALLYVVLFPRLVVCCSCAPAHLLCTLPNELWFFYDDIILSWGWVALVRPITDHRWYPVPLIIKRGLSVAVAPIHDTSTVFSSFCFNLLQFASICFDFIWTNVSLYSSCLSFACLSFACLSLACLSFVNRTAEGRQIVPVPVLLSCITVLS